MIKCWVFGHSWVNWDGDKRYCRRCGKEEKFEFRDSKWRNVRTVFVIFGIAFSLVACNMEITQKSFDVKANGELRCVSVWSAFDEPFTITEGGCVKFYGSTPAGNPGPIFCGNVTIERRVDACPVEAQ